MGDATQVRETQDHENIGQTTPRHQLKRVSMGIQNQEVSQDSVKNKSCFYVMASKINKVLCFRELPYTAKLVSIFESGKTKTKRVEGFYVETLLTDVELKRGSPYFTGKICARILQQSPSLTVSCTLPIISTHFSTTNDSF